MTCKRPSHYIQVVIEFTEQYYAKDMAHLSFEQSDTFERQLGKLKYVKTTCINHVCSVTADLETSDFEAAKRRTEHLVWQIQGLLSRWAKVKGKSGT